MKSQNAVEVANIQGRFTLYCNNRDFLKIADELFSSDPDVSIKIHDSKIFARGADDVRGVFKELELSGGAFSSSVIKELHMLNSPVIRVSERELSARAAWTTLSFVIKEIEGNDSLVSVEPVITRFDVDFIKEGNVWKILHMEWYVFTSLNPWLCSKIAGDWCFSEEKLPVPSYTGKTKAEDYWSIVRLQNTYTHARRRNMASCFAGSEEASFYVSGLTDGVIKGKNAIREEFKRLEKLDTVENEKLYLSTMLNMNPVIEVSDDGIHAEGTWLGIEIGIKGPAFGGKSPYPVSEQFIFCNQRFIKEDGEWKFLDFSAKPLFHAPMWSVDAVNNTGLISHDRAWAYPPEYTGNGTTDDYLEIENIQGMWVNSLKSSCPSKYIDQLVAVMEEGVEYHTNDPFLEADDPTLRKQAYFITGAKGVENYRAQARVIEEIKADQPHHQSSHATTTPLIIVDKDEKHATALWFDFGWTLYAEGFGLPPEKWHANPAFARYHQQFIKDRNGKWKIWRFSWYRIFAFGAMWPFKPEGIRGWCGSDSKEPWPMPFEKYVNEDL